MVICFAPTSLVTSVLMLGLIFGRFGLVLRGLRPHQQTDGSRRVLKLVRQPRFWCKFADPASAVERRDSREIIATETGPLKN